MSMLMQETCPNHKRYEEAVETIKKFFLLMKISSNASDEVFELLKDEAWTIAENEFDEKNYVNLLTFKAESELSKYNICEQMLNTYTSTMDEVIKVSLRELNPEQREKYEEVYPPQKRKRTF